MTARDGGCGAPLAGESMLERVMAEEKYARQLNEHYTPPALADAFLNVLRAWGKDTATLTPGDLAPIDQFHVGGQEATLALAQLAGVTAETRVLDVGGGFGG